MSCETEELEAPEFHLADHAVFRSAELVIIVPTLNERENVCELVDRLEACLASIHWEVIFVDDDSPDGVSFPVKRTGHN